METETNQGSATTGYGNYVKIKHSYKLNNGSVVELYTKYNHLYSVFVLKGAKVTAGTKVGGVGMSGFAEGNHLDFQVFYNGTSIDPFSNQLLALPSNIQVFDSYSCGIPYFNEVKNIYSKPLPDSTPVGSQTISDGDYHIVSAINNNFVLSVASHSKDSGANIQMSKNISEADIKSLVTVKYIGDGYYTLTMKNSGKLIDVQAGNTGNEANVQQYDSNGTDAQKWIIKYASDGYFYIISKLSGKCIEVAGGYLTVDRNVQMYASNQIDASTDVPEVSSQQSVNRIITSTVGGGFRRRESQAEEVREITSLFGRKKKR